MSGRTSKTFRRGQPVRVRRPNEGELANHLREVHHKVIHPPEAYIAGHRYPHLLLLHADDEKLDSYEPHEHPWD